MIVSMSQIIQKRFCFIRFKVLETSNWCSDISYSQLTLSIVLFFFLVLCNFILKLTDSSVSIMTKQSIRYHGDFVIRRCQWRWYYQSGASSTTLLFRPCHRKKKKTTKNLSKQLSTRPTRVKSQIFNYSFSNCIQVLWAEVVQET